MRWWDYSAERRAGSGGQEARASMFIFCYNKKMCCTIAHNFFFYLLAERQGIGAGLSLATLRHHPATVAAAHSDVRSGSSLLQAERHRAFAGKGQNARFGQAHQESARCQEPQVDQKSKLQGLQ